MSSDTLVKDFENIVNKGLETSFLPMVRGNTIRIKNYIVRHNSKKGYLIYDTDFNTQVARTQFKSSAVAIAKTLADGKNAVATILSYDTELTKHYNDAVFYRNVIQKSNDSFIKDIRQVRFDMSLERTRLIRKKIDKYIFSF
jgi:hypothetical protein